MKSQHTRGCQPRRRLFRLIGVLALLPIFSAFSSAPPSTPLTPSAVATPTVVSIGAGQHYTCKLMSDGAVICWGDDTVDGVPVGKTSPPPGIYAELSVGPHHACALNRGRPVCWGWNAYGQATPFTQWGYTQISAGLETTCALDSDPDWDTDTFGHMACWGQDPDPPDYGYQPSVIDVSVGAHHRCIVHYSYRVEILCSGDNSFGQTDIPEAAQSEMAAISAGGGHTCALEAEWDGGNIVCWGQNSEGQAPALVSGPFTQLSAGTNHTCAVRADGTLACWGENTFGQANPPAGSFTQVSAGYSHSCGVRTDGSAACWGESTFGESTVIDLAPAALPRAVSGSDYQQALATSGGSGIYSFSIGQGALPAGLSLSSAGLLSGHPAGNGIYSFTVMATDLATGHSGGRSYLLKVSDALVDFLIPNDSGRAGGFGSAYSAMATAIDGDRAVVMAPGAYDVYVFERAPGTAQSWQQVTKLNDVFGGPLSGETSSTLEYVAMSGETLLVVEDVSFNYAEPNETYFIGAIFQRDPAVAEGWSPEGSFEYGPRYDFKAFALDGDTLAAGNPGAEGPGAEPLADVRILRRHADPGQPIGWEEEQIIDLHYRWLALSGDTLAVGTEAATVLFERNTGGAGLWGQVQSLVLSGPLALSGDTLLIGEPAHDKVRVFARNQGGVNNWGEATPIARPASVSASLEFGARVLLDRNVAVVAATPPYGSLEPGVSVVFGQAPGGHASWKPLLQLEKTTDQLALSGQTLLAKLDTSIDPRADQQREIVVSHWLQLASELEAVAGSGQALLAGDLLSPAPQVLVRDINGSPLPGASVSFESGAGGAFVDPQHAGGALVSTDAAGIATMPAYRAGQAAGTYTVTARLATNLPLDQEAIGFTVRARPHGIAVVAGGGQHVPVGTTAPARLAVKLTDTAGEPIAGLGVTFSAPGSGPGGSFTVPNLSASSATLTSDASGVATAPSFRANGIPGQYVITVTVEGSTMPLSIPMANEARLYLALLSRP